jgi:sortase A
LKEAGEANAKRALANLIIIIGAVLVLAGLMLAFEDWRITSSAASGEPIVVAITATPTRAPTFTPHVKVTPSPKAPDLLPKFPGAGPSTEVPLPAPSDAAGAAVLSPTATPSAADLMPATTPPDRLVIPAIKLDAKVVPMGWRVVKVNGKQSSEWVIPENAVGWHKNSGLPGHGDNIVMSGHHNIKGEVFRRLVDVKVGDKIDVYVGSTLYRYEVAETYIVKEKGQPLSVRLKNARFMQPTGDERLTLISCWPYNNNTHRVIVVANPFDWAARSQIRGASE